MFGLATHGWLLKDTRFVANDPLTPNNTINTCLMNPNIYIT